MYNTNISKKKMDKDNIQHRKNFDYILIVDLKNNLSNTFFVNLYRMLFC